MKVLFYTYFTETYGSGEAGVAFDLARVLGEKGHKIAIVFRGDTYCVNKKNGITFYSVGMIEGDILNPSDVSWDKNKKLMDFIREFDPDIIHTHSFVPPLAVLLQMWAIANSKPFVYTAHMLPKNLLSHMNVSHEASGDLSFKEKMIEYPLYGYTNTFLQNCQVVIALNEISKKSIRETGYKGDVVVIPNGIERKKFQALQYAQIGKKTKELIFVGSLLKRKNQLYLIEVMEHLPENYHLTLIGGDITSSYQKEIEEYIKNNKVKNVTLKGITPRNKIPILFESSLLFVSASLKETQSLSVIESLASGTPIVGLSNETIDEFIDDSVGIALPVKTSPAIFAKSVKIIAEMSVEKYRKMCEKSREKVIGQDWDQISERTIDVYQRCLSEQKEILNNETLTQKIQRLMSYLGNGAWQTFMQENLFNKEKEVKSVSRWQKYKNLLKSVSKKGLIILSVGLILSQGYSLFKKATSKQKQVKE